MSPGRRVACVTMWWAVALTGALTFDALARSAGWAPPNPSRDPERLSDWITSLGVAIAVLATLLGLLVGLVAPSRSHDEAALLSTRSAVVIQLWRRSFVAAVVGGAAVGAVTAGLVSVTTDISMDDSPSTVGSAGGLLYGAVLGVVLGIGGGFVIGVAGSSFLVPFRGRRRTLLFTGASAVLVVAGFACFGVLPSGSGVREHLSWVEPVGIVLTSLVGALLSTPYLVGWYIRRCTQSTGDASTRSRAPTDPQLNSRPS